MTKLRIILIGTKPTEVVIKNYIQRLLPTTVIEIDELEAFSTVGIIKKQIGFDIDSFAEHVFTNEEFDVNTLIITKHPMESGKRVNYVTNASRFAGTAILTLKDMNNAIQKKDAAPLIYFFILQHIAGARENINHGTDCLGSSQQSYESIPSTLTCQSCKLPETESNQFYEEQFQRLYDHIQSFPRCHHVILVHGIRTFGNWVYSVRRELDFNGYEVSIEGYKRFSTLKLLGYCFFDTGKRERRSLKTTIQRIKENSPNAKLSVIAHSHGTFLVSKLLEENEIEIDNLILCGSIVKRDFPWSAAFESKSVTRVLNDAGCNDVWAGIAHHWINGAGGSGILGFESEFHSMRTVFSRDGSHSSSIKDLSHQRRLWLPFLERGEYSTLKLDDKYYTASPARTTASVISNVFLPKYVFIILLLITVIYLWLV